MSLIGKHHCSQINSTFIITEANDANGQAKGTIELDSVAINVEIHYHFEDNSGPITDMWFAGNKDNPNYYVGGSGCTDNRGYKMIKIAGGYPTQTDVNTFEGEYIRQ